MFERRLSKALETEGNVKEAVVPVGTHSERMVPFGRSISMKR
jgi:hypothetical protein